MAKKKRKVVKQKLGIARMYETRNLAEGFFRRQKKKGFRVFDVAVGSQDWALISAKRKPTKADWDRMGVPIDPSMHKYMREIKKEEDLE